MNSVKKCLHKFPAVGSVWCIFFLVASTISSRCRAEYPSLLSELDQNQRAANCGVWTVAFTLSFNSVPYDISKLANSLGTNKAWDQPVDMAHMRDVLEKSGLHTDSYKNASVDDVALQLAKSPARTVAILHLTNEFERVGHYIILISGSSNGTLFVDMGDGSDMETLTSKQLANRLKDDFSGFCMFVERAKNKTESILLDGSNFKVDAGEIVMGPGEVEIKAIVTNPQDQAIALQTAKGSCSCFKKANIEVADGKTIPAHSSATMTLTFDRSMMGLGAVQRDILLAFSGLKDGQWIQMTVVAHISADNPPVQLTWFPESINIGSRKFGETTVHEFTMFIPAGTALGEPKPSSVGLKIIPPQANETSEVDEAGRTVHRFKVDLSTLPPGPVRENITVPTTDKNTPRITIEIMGEIRK